MKRKFTFLLGLVAATSLSAKSQTISIDGNFADWDAVPYSHINNVADNVTGGTLTACKTFGDAQKLYFYMEGTTALTLPRFDLYIDTDNNPETGWISGNFPSGTGSDLFFQGNLSGGGGILPHAGGSGWSWGAAIDYFTNNVEVSVVQTLTDKRAFEFSINKSVLGATDNFVNFQFIITDDSSSPVELGSLPQYWHSAAKYVRAALTGATLPVSLVSFKGEEAAQGVKLSWATASEQNNSHFDLYRSADGKQFEKIATVQGRVNSVDLYTYYYTDTEPLLGTSYYQLRQTDLDGTTTVYKEIGVNYGIVKKNFSVSHTAGELLLNIYSEENTSSQFSLSDINGRALINRTLNLVKGQQTVKLPVNVQTGLGIATLITPAEVVTQKVLFTNQ